MDSRIPNLGGSFPHSDPNMKIHDDRSNTSHGQGHFDIMTGIPGGVDKTRVTGDGTVIGGETRVGQNKANWP